MRVDIASPARVLPFSGISNFRDLGGYVGLEGTTVRWRRLFRSDSLHRLAAADLDRFAGLGVRAVIDLRRPYEIRRDGRVPEEACPNYHHIHPEHTDWAGIDFADGQSSARWLADRYLDMAREGSAGLVAVIGVIAESAPVVVHCLAGKDRTGVVCALTLALLGVADEDIAADYALTQLALPGMTRWLTQTVPEGHILPAPCLEAPAEAMHLFLGGIRERYGSVEGYLVAAGLEDTQVAALRGHLLA